MVQSLLQKTLRKWYNAPAKNCTLVVQRCCGKFVKSGTLGVRNHKHAPGQFNIIFILEKTKKKDSKIKVVKILKSIDEKNPQNNIIKIKDHIIKNYNKEYYKDDFIEVFWSAVKQEELSNKKWHIKIKEDSNIIIKKLSKSNKLIDFCNIRQGIVSGADIVNSNNIKLLSDEIKYKHFIKEGQGIFYLKEKEKIELNLSDNEKKIVKKIYKASDIQQYNYNESNLFIIYTNKNTKIDDFPNIKEHLNKYRLILENKREYKLGKLPWFSLHWHRDESIFKGEKIVCSIWPENNIFAYSNNEMYCERNILIIKKKNITKESLKYILGILNSKIISYWFSKKISKRGKKFFLPKNDIENIPIPKIDFSVNIKSESQDKIVSLVDEIIKNKKYLKNIKDNYFDKIKTCSLRQHPVIIISSDEIYNFILKTLEIKKESLLEGMLLILYGNQQEQIVIKSKYF